MLFRRYRSTFGSIQSSDLINWVIALLVYILAGDYPDRDMAHPAVTPNHQVAFNLTISTLIYLILCT
jgi:hypothetical protein